MFLNVTNTTSALASVKRCSDKKIFHMSFLPYITNSDTKKFFSRPNTFYFRPSVYICMLRYKERFCACILYFVHSSITYKCKLNTARAM